MSIRRTATCGLVLSFVILAVVIVPVAKTANPDHQAAAAFTGEAAWIAMKGRSQQVALENPEVRSLADRRFLFGRAADISGVARTFWLPLSDVWTIEEFSDMKEMAKAYRFGAAEAKP